MMGYDGMGGGGGWGSWLLMSLTLVVILGVAACALFLVWRNSVGGAGTRRSPPGEPTPEAILGERLARGEIDSEEYRQRRDALRTQGPAAKE